MQTVVLTTSAWIQRAARCAKLAVAASTLAGTVPMDWTRGMPAPKSMLCHPLPKPRNAAPCSDTCMVVSPTAAPGRALCATQSPSLSSSSACLTPAHVGDASASQVAPSGRGGICAQNSEMSSFWQPAA